VRSFKKSQRLARWTAYRIRSGLCCIPWRHATGYGDFFGVNRWGSQTVFARGWGVWRFV